MRVRTSGLAILGVLWLAATASAQFQKEEGSAALLGVSQKHRWRAGVTVKAVGGSCRGIVVTIPVPVDWPEQTVVISDEDVSQQARVNQGRNVKAVPQMVVNIRSLPSGYEAKAILTYDITRYAQKPPADPQNYRIPEDNEVPRDLRIYLAPSLPHIDCRDDRIRQLGDMLGADAGYDWKRVEAIYEYVRGKIELKQGKMKGGGKKSAKAKSAAQSAAATEPAKEAVAKKAVAKEAVAKKAVAKKAVAKKAVAKKAVAKKTVAKKTVAEKEVASGDEQS